MPDYGPRVDPETGELHARVAQAHAYDRVTLLRSEWIAGVQVHTEMVRSPSPGTRRLVRLRATYMDGDEQLDRVIYCKDQLDEAANKRLLERDIRAAKSRSADPA